jgi:uncharacterized iron-regulated membrane protein
MSRVRAGLFWLHLAAGLVAGLCIGVMCATGVALAFQKQLLAWVERDARTVAPPAPDAPRLPLATLLERARATDPTRPQAVTIAADRTAAVAIALNRDTTLYADPYTGEIRRPARTAWHSALAAMEAWHRYLGRSGDHRPIGQALNGAANVAFLFLAVSGLCLWWPRSFTWRSVRAVAVLNLRLAGRARDFNWHHALGLWCAPVLIVLTLTALPISYRWAADGLYRLVGEEPPPSGARAPTVILPPVARPAPNATPLDADALVAAAQRAVPDAHTITLRFATGPGRDAALPITLIAHPSAAWPRTSSTTLHLDPFRGTPLRVERFADLSPGRQLRTWSRFLHTGEALGLVGQALAALASLGGCVLVYTGFALAWRRFFPRRADPGPIAPE